MKLHTKIEILRKHEIYCYQICYYFIQNEQLSTEAACQALLSLAQDSEFFVLPYKKQEKKVKFAAVHSSLIIQSNV